jgi:hypothetical protein
MTMRSAPANTDGGAEEGSEGDSVAVFPALPRGFDLSLPARGTRRRTCWTPGWVPDSGATRAHEVHGGPGPRGGRSHAAGVEGDELRGHLAREQKRPKGGAGGVEACAEAWAGEYAR